ncbi:hypothetical protein A0H81_04730 [Grifola frondosa]|uniref:Uncharacterized protein n=1 Tax=Grifola frondosa TaxID=5627 RepID=A0A1C7MHP1_GRIFR|nr:hypothetical protein A0H81_04730 [Grifola frondosa]
MYPCLQHCGKYLKRIQKQTQWELEVAELRAHRDAMHEGSLPMSEDGAEDSNELESEELAPFELSAPALLRTLRSADYTVVPMLDTVRGAVVSLTVIMLHAFPYKWGVTKGCILRLKVQASA